MQEDLSIVILGELGFFQKIAIKVVENIKAKKIERKNLTLDILILFQEKDTWTQDEIAYELGLNTKSNISTALTNLITEKLVLKDNSKKPAAYKLNIDAVNQLIEAKEKRELRATRRKKLDSKTE